jgi:peptidoglycan/LPS O-acetylase OafA/YrhL
MVTQHIPTLDDQMAAGVKSGHCPKPDHELTGIEILRFLCAFGVLIWHYQHFFFVGEWNPIVGQAIRHTLPLYRYLSFFYNNGSLAVPVFWVISGFIFYWHYAESIQSRAVIFSDFLVRRFSRLYPLHFATLIFVAAAQYVYYMAHRTTFIYVWNKPIWFVSHLLFASNWFARQPESFNGPIWSVSIEMLIYLFFFCVARTFRPNAWLAACIAAIFAVCFNFLNTFMNQEAFACGMYFFAGGVAQRLIARRAAFLVSICITLASALSMWIFGENAASLLLLATGGVVIFAKLGETGLRVAFRPLAFLGNATYSSYLLHFPLQLMIVTVVDAIRWKRDIFYKPVLFVGYLALVIGLSLVVHRYFEMPAQGALRAAAKGLFGKPRNIVEVAVIVK